MRSVSSNTPGHGISSNGAARQQRWRDNQRIAGMEQKNVYLRPEWIARHQQPGETIMQLMQRACDALDTVSSNVMGLSATSAKDVREIYQEIEADVKGLIELMGADRSTYAPDILSMRAKRLKSGFQRLQKLLSGKHTT
jgi:hypothetical protein